MPGRDKRIYLYTVFGASPQQRVQIKLNRSHWMVHRTEKTMWRTCNINYTTFKPVLQNNNNNNRVGIRIIINAKIAKS